MQGGEDTASTRPLTERMVQRLHTDAAVGKRLTPVDGFSASNFRLNRWANLAVPIQAPRSIRPPTMPPFSLIAKLKEDLTHIDNPKEFQVILIIYNGTA